MKNIIFILLVPLLLCFGKYAVSQVEPEEEVIITKPAEDSADINTFYDELSNDGDWIKVDSDEIDSDENLELSETVDIDEDVITEYVWRPRISYVYVDWNPYTYGHWVFTRFGWVWVSDYEWGWAPYHYGRWWFSARWGWVWSPGHRWAPSWVTWCHTHHHIGWHPISPRTHWRFNNGVVITHPVTPKQKSITNKWTFVKKDDFNKPITKENVINLKEDANLISGAKIKKSGDEIYNVGPNKKDLEKNTGVQITTKKVSVVNVKNGNTKTKNNNKNDVNNQTKKKDDVYRTTESNNTGEKQINKNTEPKTKQETTTKNPGTRNENNSGTKTKKETTKNTNKNTNTNKEPTKNTKSNSNTNTKKESNKNTNSNTNKETYKAPTYNPGNNNKSSNNTYKAPTNNPSSNNKSSNTNRETYKAPTHNSGNNGHNSSSNNNSKSNNSGNSNKNSSPPPKKK